MPIPVSSHPLELFEEWLSEAFACESMEEPCAFTLATVDSSNTPWTRIVLLRGLSARGFVFYTNLESIKAEHIRDKPRASLCFYWMPLGKQVRVVGSVELVSDAEADAYFATRPRDSQLGAWASDQSRPMASRNVLLQRISEYAQKFGEAEVPRPPFWSGYRIEPDVIEFWHRQPFRLHDRLCYRRDGEGRWKAQTLYP